MPYWRKSTSDERIKVSKVGGLDVDIVQVKLGPRSMSNGME